MLSHELKSALKSLKLNEVIKCFDEVSQCAEKELLSHQEFFLELLTREVDTRLSNKINRILKESSLDLRKTIESFKRERLGTRLKTQLDNLLRGDFLKHNENVIAFGNPGSGKSHLLSAIAIHLAKAGTPVLFRKCEVMVEELLIHKNKLTLSKYLKRLDKYRLIFLDDIGYVQKNREEMEVLFNFLAHRYERGSVMITSNLVFSKWDEIFKDQMTTAAAIDRVVHHSVILEMNLPSYRIEQSCNAPS